MTDQTKPAQRRTPAKKTPEEPAPAGLELLRAPFPTEQIHALPKVWCRACSSSPNKVCQQHKKGDCKECGNFITSAHVDLSYVGHADLTNRLLDADLEWDWEPLALTPAGLPAFDDQGGLWIKLTVCGKTRLGYGDSQGKRGPNAIKEAIGDALRNAAMRFGAALDLWSKSDLRDVKSEHPKNEAEDALYQEQARQVDAEAVHRQTSVGVAQAYADLAGSDKMTAADVWELGKLYQTRGFEPTVLIDRPGEKGKKARWDKWMRERHQALTEREQAGAGQQNGHAPAGQQQAGQQGPAAGDAKAGAQQARQGMRQGRDQARTRQQQAGRGGWPQDAGDDDQEGHMDGLSDPRTCTHPDGYTWTDDGKGHSGSFCLLCGTPEPEEQAHGMSVEDPPVREDWVDQRTLERRTGPLRPEEQGRYVGD